jgi:hypothetical protein
MSQTSILAFDLCNFLYSFLNKLILENESQKKD